MAHHPLPHKRHPARVDAGSPTLSPVEDHAARADCDLCGDSNWLFVLAAGGRTGSTTAMSMFDSVPGFEIGGEHAGVLNHEMQFIDQVTEYIGAQGATLAWKHRPQDLHALRCTTQEKMRRLVFGADYPQLSAKARVVGFKEIRYTTLRKMAFIASVFPCARFVFTYRNQTDTQVHSQGFSKSQLPRQWSSVGHLYAHLAETFPHQMAMLPVEDLTPGRYNDILHGLLGVRGCAFTAIAHVNAAGGYSKLGQQPGGDALLEGECDLAGVDFALRPEVQEHNARRWAALLREHQEDHRAAAMEQARHKAGEEEAEKVEEGGKEEEKEEGGEEEEGNKEEGEDGEKA
eukprot:jgi/Tetstr1/466311/TSEL_010843.t1